MVRLVRASDPEGGLNGLCKAAPRPALIGPPASLAIAAGSDEAEELGIAHQHAGGLKGLQGDALLAELVVPAIGLVALAERDRLAGDGDEAICGHGLAVSAGLGAGRPVGLVLNPVDGQLADQDTGGFQVDPLMLDPHENDPGRAVPADGKGKGHGGDGLDDRLSHLGAVGPEIRHGGPVVIGLIQVIPAHLIDADCDLGLDPGVYPSIDLAIGQELVDEECRRVAEIEDEGVAERNGLREPAAVIRNTVVKALVEVIGLAEIVKDFSALGLDAVAIQKHCAGGVGQPSSGCLGEFIGSHFGVLQTEDLLGRTSAALVLPTMSPPSR